MSTARKSAILCPKCRNATLRSLLPDDLGIWCPACDTSFDRTTGELIEVPKR